MLFFYILIYIIYLSILFVLWNIVAGLIFITDNLGGIGMHTLSNYHCFSLFALQTI